MMILRSCLLRWWIMQLIWTQIPRSLSLIKWKLFLRLRGLIHHLLLILMLVVALYLIHHHLQAQMTTQVSV
jgi:hypothetical protein